MDIYTEQTRRSIVRVPFSDDSTYRAALGNLEQLLVMACSGGHLDAPEHVPAGGMRSTNNGKPAPVFATRFD